MPTGALSWTATIPAPGGVWSQTVVVTVEMGYVGPLTNTVQIATPEGIADTSVITVDVKGCLIYLPVILNNHP